MAVYIITGNLGGGKSLMSVHRIYEYLQAGRPVATNLDIRLHNLVSKSNKTALLYRIPDKPQITDFLAIGIGNTSYDESKNGLIVLDECGAWFNSRSWGDKERQPMIDWLLHSRKCGWDVMFIVQNVSLIDKQARLALGEHVVYCRRTDRMNIPIIGSLFKLIWGGKLPLPRLHIGVVKYGLLPTSITVDTWTCVGTRLFSAYDTKQVFRDNYPHGPHSILPPWFTHRKHISLPSWGNLMRKTKIYFKRLSRPIAFAAGGMAMFVLMINLNMGPSATASVPPSPGSPQVASPDTEKISSKMDEKKAEEKPEIKNVYFLLDYVASGKGIMISFDGMYYDKDNFPHELRMRHNKLYALIPSDLADKLNSAKQERRAGASLRSGGDAAPQPAQQTDNVVVPEPDS